MRINNNLSAMNSHRHLNRNNRTQLSTVTRLSSGKRINTASADAVGLAISEKMRGQIRGLKQANKNAQDAISLIRTAEGALNEVHSMLHRMRELAVQAATDTYTIRDRGQIQGEFDELVDQIIRTAETSEFNKHVLLDGSFDSRFQIGANQGQSIGLKINSIDLKNLGIGNPVYESTSYIKGLHVRSLTGQKMTLELGDDHGKGFETIYAVLNESRDTITVFCRSIRW